MKRTLKKTLQVLGLLNLAKNIAIKVGKKTQLKQDKNINNWNMKYRELSLVYDASDRHSKWWFSPRYNGDKIHEPKATDIFIDYIKSDDIVLDIGGHLGYFSCIAGRLAKNGTVHVFEVDPKCLILINKNTKLNDLDNVFIHNIAVSDSKEIVKIPQLGKPNPGLIINSNFSSNYIEVESVIIDDFLAQNNIKPDFIKIDIEGAEWKALKGMKKTLKYKNVTILVEIHVDNLRNKFNTNYKEIIKLLIECGYSLKQVEHRRKDGNMMIVDFDTELRGNTMILCVKKGN